MPDYSQGIQTLTKLQINLKLMRTALKGLKTAIFGKCLYEKNASAV